MAGGRFRDGANSERFTDGFLTLPETTSNTSISIKHWLNGKLVPLDELFGLARVKTPAVVPTARTQLAPTALGELQAVELGAAFEQADDVSGVEGVAAAGAVDERNGIGAELDAKLVGDRDTPRARPA